MFPFYEAVYREDLVRSPLPHQIEEPVAFEPQLDTPLMVNRLPERILIGGGHLGHADAFAHAVERFQRRCSIAELVRGFGMKKQNYDLSMEIGQPLFEEIKKSGVDRVITGCGSCAMQIAQGTGKVEVNAAKEGGTFEPRGRRP